MRMILIIIGICLLSMYGFECGTNEPSHMGITVVLGTGYAGDSIKVNLNGEEIFNGKVTTDAKGIAWSKDCWNAWEKANNSFYFSFVGKNTIYKDLYLKKPSTVVFNYTRNNHTIDFEISDGLLQ